MKPQTLPPRAAEALLLDGERDVLALVAGGAPLAQVLGRLMNLVEARADGMLCSVLLLERGCLRHGAAPSLPDAYNRAIDGVAIGPAVGSCGTAAYRREQVIVTDTLSDPLWADFRELARDHGLRACWSAPILATDGSVLGTFAMYYREPRAPSPEHARLIDMAVQMARVAIERKAGEERLRESEEMLRTIFERTPGGIAITDLKGRFLRATPSYLRLVGYSEDELRQLTIEDLTHQSDYPENRRLLEELFSLRRDEFVIEKRYVRKDKRIIWVRNTVTLIFGKSGEPRFCIALVQDITERKEAGRRLRESEARLRAFMDHSPAMMFMKDLQGRYVDVNTGFLRRFGLNRGEALGRTDTELFSREQASLFVDNDARVLKEGAIEVEETAHYGDGVHVSIVNKFPIRDALGETVSVGGVVTDITERKAAEDALRASEERFRLLIDNVRDYAIFLLDPEGRVASWNAGAERVKGYRSEEILGRDFTCFYPPEELARRDPREQLEIARRDGRFEGEGWRVRKDRTQFWAHVVITALLDRQGVVKGYSKITQDITRRKRAEDDLRSYAERLKSTSRRIVEVQEQERRRLARELHDEIGQKLGALGINLGIIRDRLSPETRKAVEERISDSIDMVKNFGGAIRGVMTELRPTVLEDYGLVAAVRSLAERATRLSGMRVEVEGAEPPPELPIGVEVAMFRVAQEALNNAVKHARAQHVKVSVAERDRSVNLVVEDDGIGFAPPAAESGVNEGWGLFIMRERAEAVGASFSLESSKGSGTRVTMVYQR